MEGHSVGLFLLAAQMLCSHINASSLKGVTIAEREGIRHNPFSKDERQI